MAGGYASQPSDLGVLKARLAVIERRLDNMAGAAGILSAVIGSGGVTVKDGGGMSIDAGGFLRAYHSNGEGAIYFGALLPEDIYESGLLLADPLGAARFWVAQRDDGVFEVVSRADRTRLVGGEVSAGHNTDTDLSSVAAKRVELSTSTEQLVVWGLPTTTESGNVRIQVVNGEPRLYYGNASNEELKDDLEPLAVTPADVLAIEVKQWSEGDRTVIGVTAEQVGSIESVAPLLIRPRYPEGESVEYDRIPILQQVVLRDHENRIAALEAENAELKSKLDDVLARLDALEAA